MILPPSHPLTKALSILRHGCSKQGRIESLVHRLRLELRLMLLLPSQPYTRKPPRGFCQTSMVMSHRVPDFTALTQIGNRSFLLLTFPLLLPAGQPRPVPRHLLEASGSFIWDLRHTFQPRYLGRTSDDWAIMSMWPLKGLVENLGAVLRNVSFGFILIHSAEASRLRRFAEWISIRSSHWHVRSHTVHVSRCIKLTHDSIDNLLCCHSMSECQWQ